MENLFVISIICAVFFGILNIIAVAKWNYWKQQSKNAFKAYKDLCKSYNKIVNDPYGDKENTTNIIYH
jgi:hypothetical protein